MKLTAEQIKSLDLLVTTREETGCHINEVGHQLEVEFMFPYRFLITQTGHIFACTDLEYNKYSMTDVRPELQERVSAPASC